MAHFYKTPAKMKSTWAEVHAAWKRVPSIKVAAAKGEMETSRGHAHPAHALVDALLDSAPVYRNLSVNADATLNMLRYLYEHMRCGILVCIRNNAVQLLLPFVNRKYTNTWHGRVRLVAHGVGAATVAQYAAAVQEPKAGDMLPLGQWWLNGGTVCNIEAPGGWGTMHLDKLREQLDAAAAAAAAAGSPLPDADFFLNKRDYPQLRAALHAEPYARFTGEPALSRERYSCYAPVFSFYTSVPGAATPLGMADLPMPTPDDWASACEAERRRSCEAERRRSCDADPDAPVLPDAPAPAAPRPIAVFRGSATGVGVTPETNVRRRLAAFAARNADIVDVGIVSWNDSRDRVVATTPDGAMVVTRASADARAPTARRMSLAEQAATFAYFLYADGHAAAGRYGTLMHLGRVILRVETEQPECGYVWAFADTVPAFIPRDDDVAAARLSVPDDADHFVISADLSNLRATVEFLRAHKKIARRVAACARSRAPTKARITQYWRHAIAAVAARQAPAFAASDGAGGGVAPRAWFAAADDAYAATSTHATAPLV
jgi:hypothetical protein